MGEFRLIPYKVESVTNHAEKIPEGVKMIKAQEIWEESRKGSGVVVAIIDTGCQPDHPDLKDRIIGGKNFTNQGNDNDFSDQNGHGTHVAGTIAAAVNHSGVVGVAPEANLLILKVLDSEGNGTTQGIIDAINYAVSWKGTNGQKVRVINMSLGGRYDDPRLHDAVKNAVSNDILVVCAAGNEGDPWEGGDCSPKKDEFSYPGAYNEVVEIGAIGLDRKFPCFTNTNKEVDLVAPGVNILSTFPQSMQGGYATLSGTSMAAPHVSGAAALLINKCEKEFGRTLTEPEIYAQLVKYTSDLGYDKRIEGNGLLNLAGECFAPSDIASI
ncbi:S8 family peptidase [Pseudobacteroides cellulosolvens]|uniref:Subtilisin n=1 Tax=Pseudobacteroides cellulosolvens ATCC 35603 = DSM 2933 TaxID=398512 RepID=A0A0L6JIN8_9FIRM|nr:S8 family peptidase [Pseudobacteroides cellulosolvens]KNY25609.1 Subtilisin [Pseudobacteroides cellulosolvens ATCC 35603 = DSM 2933]